MNNEIEPEYQNLGSIISSVSCDVCQDYIDFGTLRYHCTEYNSYDICQACYSSTSHPFPTYPDKYGTSAHLKRISKATSVAEALYVAFQCYSVRPCIGEKKGDKFEWVTFKEVFNRAMIIGNALRHKLQMKERDKVVIFSGNSVEWVITNLGCMMQGFVVVPVHHIDRDVSSLSFIINNCDVSSVFCETESANLFLELQSTKCPTLKHIVVYPSSPPSSSSPSPSFFSPSSSSSSPPPLSPSSHSFNESNNWNRLIKYSDLEASVNTDYNDYLRFHPLDPSDIITIMHTSGSTGKSKGAPFTDKLWREHISITQTLDPNVAVCFEPLAYFSSCEFLHRVLISGGRTALINISTRLIEDIAQVSPCTLSTTPRFWNVIHSKYKQALLLEQSQSTKDPETIKKEVLSRFRVILGFRLMVAGVGGAAPSSQLLQFLNDCFGESIAYDAYGSTETGNIAGKGGSLVSGVNIKMIDVPELGYFSTDVPYPRGELYVQTKTLINGYYNNPEDTERLFVDGWFCTGDIVELLGNRRIKIIDRKKNFFKLSQGEYVAAERLETKYLSSSFVDQIFITCGDITKYEQNSVFAIVVPHLHLLREWAKNNGIHQSDSDLCSNKVVVDMVLQNLQMFGRLENLAPFEIPGHLLLEPEMFTMENRKMTASNKLARPILEHFYKDNVNGILEQNVNEENVLWKLLQEILDISENIIEDKNKSLIEIGGDSLSAIRLSSVLNSKLKIEIPPHILMDKSTTLEKLSQIISPNYDSKLQLEFINSQISNDLSLLKSIPVPSKVLTTSSSDVSNILVTGATGFVGAHLVAKLLKDKKSSQIVCIVRNSSQFSSVQNRLHSIFQQLQLWNDVESGTGRLSIIEGDFGKDNLGLNNQQYKDLLKSVDMVLHCGAGVNHVLPYSSLRIDNVIGTKNIIEFTSRTDKRARLNFISTISCIPNVPKSASHEEILGYVVKNMQGYAQSKFVSEMLVRKSLDDKIVYGSIFRLGMVGWNSLSGVGNKNDWLYKLFAGIKILGMAPESSAEFEMLPVNIVAEVLSSLSFDHSSIGSVIDICGNNLIPFKMVSKHLGVELKPFSVWQEYLKEQLDKSNEQQHKDRKTLEGLLLFSQGLPDDTNKREEIIERTKFCWMKFNSISSFNSYDEGVVKLYLEFVQ